MKKITIIIVTFNSELYIEECLKSIWNNSSTDIKNKISTIIIDNSPNGRTIKRINQIDSGTNDVKVIKSKTNIGFARAVNIGIKSVKEYDYILLLNPDTVLKEDSISKLVSCLERNNAGICGGKTIGVDGNESGSYFRFPNIFVGLFDFTNLRKICKNDKWHKYFYYMDSTRSKKEFPVDVVTGGYMLMSKKTIERIGLLDERFFMYLEDVDYCIRAKRKGLKIFHTDKSEILHVGGASSANKDRIRHTSWLSSRKKYFIKNGSLFDNLILQPIFIFDDLFILTNKYLSTKGK